MIYLRYIWHHSIQKHGFIGAFITFLLGLISTYIREGSKGVEDLLTSGGLINGAIAMSLWIALLIIFHGIRSPLALKIDELSIIRKNNLSNQTLRLSEQENQVSCAEYVSILYCDMIDNWSQTGISSHTLLGTPRAITSFQKLVKASKDLRISDITRSELRTLIDYFDYEAPEHYPIIAMGNYSIKTIFKTRKALDKEKDKINAIAKRLANDLSRVSI